MKTCPNCGSKMEADVNFCTVCGTNIKNVPLDGQQTQPQAEPVQEQKEQPQPKVAPQVKPVQQESQQQNVQSQPQQPSQAAQVASDTFAKVSSAVKNFDKESLWKWFVTSWKTPSAEQKGEKWYGIATLLVEILLFTLGLTYGLKRLAMAKIPSEYMSQFESRINGIFHTLGFDVFIIVLVVCAGIIFSSFISSKFAHGYTVSFFDYVNKIVQMSNLSLITVVVMSVLLFFDAQGTYKVTIPLAIFTVFLFLIAAGLCVKDGPQTARDPFYGVILYIILVAVIVMILYAIFKDQLTAQMNDMFNFNVSDYLD